MAVKHNQQDYKGEESKAEIYSLHLRPSLSPEGPASPAPQNAPPVKNETTIPLDVVNTGRWLVRAAKQLTSE